MGNRTATTPTLTSPRAARLYRLLTLLDAGPQLRDKLLKSLKIDVRGYYRDLEYLRSLGITVNVDGTRYSLVGALDAALARLPFPDAGLSIHDALVLARGSTDVHRRFRRRVETMLGQTKPTRVAGSSVTG
jgi:hypothetical protein